MNSQFIRISALKELLEQDRKLYLFGVSENGKWVIDLLRYHGFMPSYVIDNDTTRHGNTVNGVPIISLDQFLCKRDGIIIIMNSYYAEIYEQLENNGVSDVYELSDLDASAPIDKILQDYRIKEKYSSSPSVKTFFYVADGFGDNIIKYPLLKRLSESENCDDFYFLTDRQSNYDLYKSLFKNVYIYDRDRFQVEDEYRAKVQTKVNKMHFSKKICFCSSAYYCTHFDPFGTQNTNIPIQQSFYECCDWQNGRSQHNAIEDLQRMATKMFGWYDFDLSQKGAFSSELSKIKKPLNISNKYVAFGMGGISWDHVYKASSISEVVEWFLKMGFSVVLLGYGTEDEKYNKEVCRLCGNRERIIDLTSKCNAFESLKILEDSELFIGLDSALAHGVYAMDKKGIVLMSGNSFSRRFMHENDEKIKYLTTELDCLGCYQCKYGKWNNQMDKRGLCFSSVSPQTIVSAARELLQ